MIPPLYLSIQNSYNCLQLALFSQKACLQKVVLLGTRASSHLVLHVDDLLKKQGVTLLDLDFIAIDAGPGAFTSLRVAIASVNGIGFGHKVPLIGVDGLEALLQDDLEKASSNIKKITGVIGLLNAYNHDAYFCLAPVQEPNNKQKGCKKIYEVIKEAQQMFPDGNLLVIGNGALVFAAELQEAFGDRLVIDTPLQEVPSVERIALLGYQAWLEQKEKSYRITPNYLKTQLFVLQK